MFAFIFFLFFTIPPFTPQPEVENAYETWFVAGTTRHHGLLLQTPQGWSFRVRYKDAACNCEHLIEQTMHAEKTNLGIILRGQKVQDLRDKSLRTDYAPDNLYLHYDRQGRLFINNIDQRGNTSVVTLRAVEPSRLKVVFKQFN